MLLLQRETVANRNPCFRGIKGLLKRLMCQVTEINLLFEVPETTRVILNAFDSVRFLLISLLVILSSLIILHYLHVGPSDIRQHPPCVKLVLWKFFKLFNRLRAVVRAQMEESIA